MRDQVTGHFIQPARIRKRRVVLPSFDHVLPDVLRTKFRWVHSINITSTNAPQTATLKIQGNGPGHPVLGANTHAPYGWSFANQFYEYYYVHGSSIRISIQTTSGSQVYTASVRPQPSYSNTGTTTQELELEKDHAQFAFGQTITGGNSIVLAECATTRAMEGPFSGIQNQNYCASTAVGVVPGSTWTWLLQAACIDDATALTFWCTIEVEYDVELFQRITIAQSPDH